MFDLVQVGAYDCKVSAKSRSNSPSYYDWDTNYCNMWNVFNALD